MGVQIPTGFRTFAKRLTILSAILFAIPFPFYAWSRAAGDLPSEAEWWARGMNHGPWRWELPMVFVVVPMYLLLLMVVVALAGGLIWSYETRRPLPAALSLGHAALIFGLFYAQAFVLYWTID